MGGGSSGRGGAGFDLDQAMRDELVKLLDDVERDLAVSLVEGWLGEICHVALTDDEGILHDTR